MSPCTEPTGGIVTHHVGYREESFARSRLELLCGGSARNASNDAIGNRTIQRRFDSLDAVYRQDWSRVNNLRGDEPMYGVHPEMWPDPRSSRRWYSEGDVETAKEKWRSDSPAGAG